MIILSLSLSLLLASAPDGYKKVDCCKLECNYPVHYAEESCKKCKFKKHFSILDSTVTANPQDTVYNCCPGSIYFMVENTGIEVSTEGTLLGRISFSKHDWTRWHDWYDRKYNKKRKR